MKHFVIIYTNILGAIIMYKPYYLKDVIKSEKRELFTVMSTFALIGGGSSTGYRLDGGKYLQ